MLSVLKKWGENIEENKADTEQNRNAFQVIQIQHHISDCVYAKVTSNSKISTMLTVWRFVSVSYLFSALENLVRNLSIYVHNFICRNCFLPFLSILMSSSNGSLLPSLCLPRPSPCFHPIFCSRNMPMPPCTGAAVLNWSWNPWQPDQYARTNQEHKAVITSEPWQ